MKITSKCIRINILEYSLDPAFYYIVLTLKFMGLVAWFGNKLYIIVRLILLAPEKVFVAISQELKYQLRSLVLAKSTLLSSNGELTPELTSQNKQIATIAKLLQITGSKIEEILKTKF